VAHDLSTGESGDRSILTIKDIALLAQVSTATVSNVLNGRHDQVGPETRDKVMKIVKDTHYKPNRVAKSLRTSRTHTIGVIVEDITVFNTPPIVNGINLFAERHHYHIILNDLGLHSKIGHRFEEIARFKREIDAELDVMLSLQIDGIIYVGLHPRDVSGIVSRVSKPIVYADCYSRDTGQPSVVYDDRTATFEATRMLIRSGHREIAVISGPADSAATQSRLAGYKEALLEEGIEFQPARVQEGTWEYDSGVALCKQILSCTPRVTAVMAHNDLMAVGAMNAAQEEDLRVPGDLSVVGFDDRDFSQYTSPGLTTVRLPLRQMGYAAAEKLLTLPDKTEQAGAQIELPCELIVRSSAGILID